MSQSKPFLENGYIGANLLSAVHMVMRDEMDLAVEFDYLGQCIAIGAYGRADMDVLASVVDQLLAEIQQDATILFRPDEDFRLHYAIVNLLRDEGGRVDPDHWLRPLARRILQYLRLNN